MLRETEQLSNGIGAAHQTGPWNFGTLWCEIMHDSAMWPIHGQYECRTCGRYYPVPWAENDFSVSPAESIAAAPARTSHAGVISARSN
jgi:hypothetical protein